MTKYFLILTTLFFSLSSYAQFKIISNGEARLWTNNMGPWDQTFITYANNDYSKCYIVSRNGTKFYVRGDGHVYSRGSYITSDSTLKDDIQIIPNALYKLKHLSGITYCFKDDEEIIVAHSDNHNGLKDSLNILDTRQNRNPRPKKKEMGLIAQNVLEFVPEAVDTFENGNLAVSYDALVGLLIEAMKEQQTQIESLQTIVYSQEQEIVSIKKAVDKCCSKDDNQLKLKSSSINNVISTMDETLPENAKLFNNVPNPFSINTKIKFEIPENSNSAKLIIHDMQGIELKSFNITQKGTGRITINGSELKAGMYLYTLLIDNRIIDTKRMLLTKE